MIRIASAQLWVHDQDEALEFYTKKGSSLVCVGRFVSVHDERRVPV